MTQKLLRNQNRDVFHGRSSCTETGPCPVRVKRVEATNNRPKLDQRDLDRMHRGARNYAQGQKSDPFAAQTVAAHMKTGISGIHFDDKGRQVDAFYDAKLGLEQRSFTKPDGTVEKYNVEIVVDMKRP